MANPVVLCTPPSTPREKPKPKLQPPGGKQLGFRIRWSRECPYDVQFESLEMFQSWICKSEGDRRPRANSLWGRSAEDTTPGFGLITALYIDDPALHQRCIESVRWVHWGDGGVRAVVMTDPCPAPSPENQEKDRKHAYKQATIRRSHLKRCCLNLILLKRGFKEQCGLPSAAWHDIGSYLVPGNLHRFVNRARGPLQD